MEKYLLGDYLRGWFVGGFEPSLFKTTEVEIAIQEYRKGDQEASHCHKIATEITVLVQGKARMNGILLEKGSIVKVKPGEYTDFEALEDSIVTVVKLPGALNDKYLEAE